MTDRLFAEAQLVELNQLLSEAATCRWWKEND